MPRIRQKIRRTRPKDESSRPKNGIRGKDTSTIKGLANNQALFDSYFKFYGPARENSVSAELIELVRLRLPNL